MELKDRRDVTSSYFQSKQIFLLMCSFLFSREAPNIDEDHVVVEVEAKKEQPIIEALQPVVPVVHTPSPKDLTDLVLIPLI